MSQRHLIDQLRDQVRNPRNRLEVHGLIYRMNGFPLYDPEEDDKNELTQIGEVTEALWDWAEDLSGDDRAYFWLMVRVIQHGLKQYGSDKDREYFTHPKIMQILVEEYGIRCWHYPAHRRPQLAEKPPFECLVCGCYVFPKEPTHEEMITFRNRNKLTVLEEK